MTYRYPYLLLIAATLIGLHSWGSARSTAQGTPITPASKSVPQITFNDQVCANIVRMYLQKSKAKAIRIRINLTPVGYQCTLLAAYYYENIANYAPAVWGQWQNCLVVFRGNSISLSRAIRLTQPTNSTSLMTYLQHILPDDRPALPKSPKGITRLQIDRDYDEFGWSFKMEGGRDVWFSKDGGYSSETEVPDSLPPVPGVKSKP